MDKELREHLAIMLPNLHKYEVVALAEFILADRHHHIALARKDELTNVPTFLDISHTSRYIEERINELDADIEKSMESKEGE